MFVVFFFIKSKTRWLLPKPMGPAYWKHFSYLAPHHSWSPCLLQHLRSEHVTTMESHFYQCFGLDWSYSCLYRTIKRLKRKFIIYIYKNTFYPLCGFSIFTFLYGWGLKFFTVCCIPLLLYPEVIGSALIVKSLLHFNRIFPISYSYIFLWNLAKPVDITY